MVGDVVALIFGFSFSHDTGGSRTCCWLHMCCQGKDRPLVPRIRDERLLTLLLLLLLLLPVTSDPPSACRGHPLDRSGIV